MSQLHNCTSLPGSLAVNIVKLRAKSLGIEANIVTQQRDMSLYYELKMIKKHHYIEYAITFHELF